MAVALSIDPKSVVDSVPLALNYLSDRGEECGVKKNGRRPDWVHLDVILIKRNWVQYFVYYFVLRNLVDFYLSLSKKASTHSVLEAMMSFDWPEQIVWKIEDVDWRRTMIQPQKKV